MDAAGCSTGRQAAARVPDIATAAATDSSTTAGIAPPAIASTPAPQPAADAAADSSASGCGVRQRKKMQHLEATLQSHMDCEDRRVKELTEGILYELLPACLQVMLPSCEDPLLELDTDKCRVRPQSSSLDIHITLFIITYVCSTCNWDIHPREPAAHGAALPEAHMVAEGCWFVRSTITCMRLAHSTGGGVELIAVLSLPLPLSLLPLLLPLLHQAVAGAALAASALMNAPPGFLEFLLCIPWRQLPQLYPTALAARQGAGNTTAQQQQQELLAQSAVDATERKLLVNLPLHPQLVQPVLQFMYKPQHSDSVAPLLRPEHVRQAQLQQLQRARQAGLLPPAATQQTLQLSPSPAAATAVGAVNGQQQAAGGISGGCTADPALLETAAALLDGATPLHCAALRGNPAQVDHLLFCGADATLRTAAGELPLQLVPLCGCVDRTTRCRACYCLGPVEQEVGRGWAEHGPGVLARGSTGRQGTRKFALG